MKAATRLLICVLVAVVGTGCATVVTKEAKLNEAPYGVRIYPPKVYLLVDTVEKKTTIAYLPDYSRAYDLKPLTIFAKQDFKILRFFNHIEMIINRFRTYGFFFKKMNHVMFAIPLMTTTYRSHNFSNVIKSFE